MHTIIAGRFEQQSQSQLAARALVDEGFSPEHICVFFQNPRGQHDAYEIGGDHDRSEGAEDSGKGLAAGSTAGAAAGAAIGAATLPVTGPAGAVAGAFVGAHIGNVMGAMNSMKDDGQSDVPQRHAGMVVAVQVEDDQEARLAAEVLQSLGAEDMEQASGTIEGGDWQDFDPVSTPHPIHSQPSRQMGR